jgi:hypothetical protein
MAGIKRDGKSKSLRYFFLNDKIHKVLKASRSKDEMIAWCYPDKKRVMYSYSQVKKNMETAYTVVEVAYMLNKHRVTIQEYILNEKVATPQKIYPIGQPDSENWSQYMFNQKNILDIHQHILDSGHSKEIPSKAEVQALLKNNLVLYTKTEDGKFVPVWKAE